MTRKRKQQPREEVAVERPWGQVGSPTEDDGASFPDFLEEAIRLCEDDFRRDAETLDKVIDLLQPTIYDAVRLCAVIEFLKTAAPFAQEQSYRRRLEEFRAWAENDGDTVLCLDYYVYRGQLARTHGHAEELKQTCEEFRLALARAVGSGELPPQARKAFEIDYQSLCVMSSKLEGNKNRQQVDRLLGMLPVAEQLPDPHVLLRACHALLTTANDSDDCWLTPQEIQRVSSLMLQLFRPTSDQSPPEPS